jgi:hypothetical protein
MGTVGDALQITSEPRPASRRLAAVHVAILERFVAGGAADYGMSLVVSEAVGEHEG